MPAPPLGSEPATVSATGRIGFALYRPRRLCNACMQIEVFPTDAEAFDAAAEAAAAALRDAAGAASATAALPGGRAARGVLVALATRGDVPWPRVEWFL